MTCKLCYERAPVSSLHAYIMQNFPRAHIEHTLLASSCDASRRPRVVLLHGFLGDRRDVEPLRRALHAHFGCVSFDLPDGRQIFLACKVEMPPDPKKPKGFNFKLSNCFLKGDAENLDDLAMQAN